MATNTTKLSLRKPATTDNVSVETDLNQNYDKIDAAIGTFVCTSSTRPTTLNYAGRLIFETDTSRLLVRTSGGQWKTLNGRTNIGAPITTTSLTSISNTSSLTDPAIGLVCVTSAITTDGVSTYEITGSWPGVVTTAQPAVVAERNGLAVFLHRYTQSGGVYTISATLNTAYVSREIGYNSVSSSTAAPGGSGTLVARDTPAAGTYYYALRAVRWDAAATTNNYRIENSATSPSRLNVVEVEGAVY